jgi:tRNA(Arg) A34 adenosine deaminase TadA
MEQEKKFMQEAIKLALINVDIANGGPFGAVVVKDGEIVGKGQNEVTAKNDPTAHAEIVAIRDACQNLGTFDLRDCELYASCEPCPMCLGSIYWANIHKLYYAATKDDAAKADFDDAHIYQEFALPKEKRSIPSAQLLREEAVKVFDKWMSSEKKIHY